MGEEEGRETGWEAIGATARARRERLGLNQDELAQYGGPGVSTVGKFERATATFPPKTQQQIEKALGWGRGTIEQFVDAFDKGEDYVEDWSIELINDNIPDMARPLEQPWLPALGQLPTGEIDERLGQQISTIAVMLVSISKSHRQEAVMAVLELLLQHLRADTARIEERMAAALSEPSRRSDVTLAAHDEEVSIEDEQTGGSEA